MSEYDIDAAIVGRIVTDTETILTASQGVHSRIQGFIDDVEVALGSSPVLSAFSNFAGETLLKDIETVLTRSDNAVFATRRAIRAYVIGDEEMLANAQLAAGSVVPLDPPGSTAGVTWEPPSPAPAPEATVPVPVPVVQAPEATVPVPVAQAPEPPSPAPVPGPAPIPIPVAETLPAHLPAAHIPVAVTLPAHLPAAHIPVAVTLPAHLPAAHIPVAETLPAHLPAAHIPVAETLPAHLPAALPEVVGTAPGVVTPGHPGPILHIPDPSFPGMDPGHGHVTLPLPLPLPESIPGGVDQGTTPAVPGHPGPATPGPGTTWPGIDPGFIIDPADHPSAGIPIPETGGGEPSAAPEPVQLFQASSQADAAPTAPVQTSRGRWGLT
ncbi:DUF6507 family protein [Arthrobacter sp. zg-Y20]|uniref:DUF6507 family protein n=1 Tax=Arthrobacter sp. zg-Y20 TaxID=2886938 RepID=UPI001D14D428|nr:DUF6507 family protein [Arthrobacter sp. zg-Y20]